VTLGVGRRIGVLIAPWAFVCLFTVVWFGLLLPRALDGHVLMIVVCLVAGLALVCFALAAITFSWDVLRGRWP
jgi:hypothetical protein